MAIAEILTEQNAKDYGAYYTSNPVAEFLVAWAVRSPEDRILDPSFGDGVFLAAGCRRLMELGGEPEEQIYGVELDSTACTSAAKQLHSASQVDLPHLLCRDFFELAPSHFAVEAVVGNPPFIRYQRFSGESRKAALKHAACEGVKLTQLASSWAPFLVHSVSMIGPGGRLAMVVPFEIAHAAYARPVLAHLSRTFGRVTFLTFERRLFPDLNEDTMLLLGEEKGLSCPEFHWRHLRSHDDLQSLLPGSLDEPERTIPNAMSVASRSLYQGEARLVEYHLPRRTREMYRELCDSGRTQRLGDMAKVGIGYVTGANDYFHMSGNAADLWEIPGDCLKPALYRGRPLTGLYFTRKDWSDATVSGEAGYLLSINRSSNLPAGVTEYLKDGERAGVAQRYKCRTRSPWYAVPHVKKPDAFLTYMSGHTPKLVANSAGLVAPNSLHMVCLRRVSDVSPDHISLIWLNSLTRLSTEIQGHALGGGMLKLEPTEAKNVLLPKPFVAPHNLTQLAREVDGLLRSGKTSDARRAVDEAVLTRGLGLSVADCRHLREGADLLLARRLKKKDEVADAA